MLIKTILLLVFFMGHAFGSESVLLKIDTSSLESIKEIMPEAIIVDRVSYHDGLGARKEIGPRLRENYRINVEVLIPKMIKIMQDQQAQIEKLKAQKERDEN